MVLHNPNNWHWVNKDASGWARDYLDKHLTGLSAEDESAGVSAKISKLASVDGDVDVSQRKGKVITLFDVKVQLEYEGQTGDEEDVTGSIKIPEVAHDTEEDEYVFDIGIHDETSSKQSVKDLVRSKIVPQLRVALAKLGPTMIAEHTKGLQHAADQSPSSGFSTPTTYPQTSKSPAAPASETTAKTSSTGKVAVNTTTVTADDEFRTTAEELYKTFTDPDRLAVFTRGPPRQFDGAKVGGKFSIFDGNVTGEYVTLDEPNLLVQRWRLAQWPEGHFSTQELRFDQNNVHQVTSLRVKWEGVPIGQEDVVRKNWETYYVRSIKQAFGLFHSPSFIPIRLRMGMLIIALLFALCAIGLARYFKS